MNAEPERKREFTTPSGTPIQRVYGPGDVAGIDFEKMIGAPGEPPFTRGVHPTMYRGRLWTMRQYSGYGTAAETNARFRYLLERGQTGLSLAFDLPTQMGFDSDEPMAEGEVGRVGVAIDSLDDMRVVFREIPLDAVSVSMTINATAPILLALLVAAAEERGIARATLSGTVQNDILKEYIARGTYIYPPEPSLRLVTDLFAFCSREMPRWNSISVSGYHIREAGSTAAQEIAFTLANALAYIDAGRAAGLDPRQFIARLSFFFNVHNQFLEEIAKFRAARRLWARLLGERYGIMDPALLKLRFHAQTAGSTLTAQEPRNNIVRVAFQAMAAALGGAQSLHTNSYDEALSLPSEEAALLALRTQQVLAYETGIADSVDPLGGSYMIERLTTELETRAAAILSEIDAMGGVLAALGAGYFHREIAAAAYAYQRAIESGEIDVIGVNRFASAATENESGSESEPASPGGDNEHAQRARLAAWRAGRDGARASASLEALGQAADDARANLIPRMIDAVKAGATLGEISGRLRERFGVYREKAAL